jgi:hypothetical protein
MNFENIMKTFHQDISSLMWDYKNKILRKHLNSDERAAKLNELGLHGEVLEQSDEVTLYHKMQHVISDVENWIARNIQPAAWYSGMEEFLQHSKKTISNYQIEDDKVMNTMQTAAHAMINAIQLMSLPEEKLSASTRAKIESYALIIVKYGSGEQQQIFINALKNHIARAPQFFNPILEYLYKSENEDSL